MEATVVVPLSGLGALPTSRKPVPQLCRPMPPRRVVALMAKRKAGGGTATATPTTAPEQKKTVTTYNDNWFDRLAINHISKSVQAATGIWSEKEGYEGFVEAAASVMRNFGGEQQQDLVLLSLHKAFPEAILTVIRTMLPQSKFTREFFATFTTIFFPWLVGPCEVRESEFQGRTEKNVVYIPKCRFLEASNCAGMCTNLCKMPSQKFIEDSLGVPVYMVPNFEDMSCEMIFGQHPPADDPALKQPCYQKSCIAKQTHGVSC